MANVPGHDEIPTFHIDNFAVDKHRDLAAIDIDEIAQHKGYGSLTCRSSNENEVLPTRMQRSAYEVFHTWFVWIGVRWIARCRAL